MDLFQLQVSEEKLHQRFSVLLTPENATERDVLAAWASGMPDRDGKFVRQFESTFESSLWELYLHACLKELGDNCPLLSPNPYKPGSVFRVVA